MYLLRLPSFVRLAAIALVLALAGGVDGASLKVCKQTCGPSIEASCLGLRKGKLKKCRKRVWKACKRGETDCVVVTSTTATTSTTLALGPTSSTIAPTTTTTTTTTSTTLSPDDNIVFRGTWNVHPTVVSNGCNLPVDNDDVLEVHGTAAQATAMLSNAEVALTGQIDDEGNLLLSGEFVEEPGCSSEVTMELVGPVEHTDETTTGELRVTRRCGGIEQCQTLLTLAYDRRLGS